jgi:hypothetical protein
LVIRVIWAIPGWPGGILCQPCPTGRKPITKKIVGISRLVAVTPAILKECGLEGENFEIDGGDGKIIVRPAKA